MTNKDRAEWRKQGKLAGLRLIREPAAIYIERPSVPIRAPSDVVKFMLPLAAIEPAEVFWVLPLDSQTKLIGSGPIVVTRGILNSSLVHPREVFRGAILAGAAALILCHNHPSGDPTPSHDDRVVTEKLVAAGRLLDIPVHDHVILGDVAGTACRYTSFAEAGLL